MSTVIQTNSYGKLWLAISMMPGVNMQKKSEIVQPSQLRG